MAAGLPADMRRAQSGPVPCSGAERRGKALDEVCAAIPGDGVAGNALRISSKTGGKLACRRDWLLHSLVVRRAAPSSLRMIIRSIVEAARGLDNKWL